MRHDTLRTRPHHHSQVSETSAARSVAQAARAALIGFAVTVALAGCATAAGANTPTAPTAPSVEASSTEPAAPTATAAPPDSAPPAPEPTVPSATAPASQLPAQSASPSASPASPAPAAVDGERFTTQTRSISIVVPDDWTVYDASYVDEESHPDGPTWTNSVAFISDDGFTMSIYEGYGADAGYAVDDFGIVSRGEAGSDGAAPTAWWTEADGHVSAHIAFATLPDDGQPNASVWVDGRRQTIGTDANEAIAEMQFATRAEAVAFLESPRAQQMLAMLETVEVFAVPWDAMP